MSEPKSPVKWREVTPVCVDCRRALRPGEPRISVGGRYWRCAGCEYDKQRTLERIAP